LAQYLNSLEGDVKKILILLFAACLVLGCAREREARGEAEVESAVSVETDVAVECEGDVCTEVCSADAAAGDSVYCACGKGDQCCKITGKACEGDCAGACSEAACEGCTTPCGKQQAPCQGKISTCDETGTCTHTGTCKSAGTDIPAKTD